ncbi:MAG: FecR domain-containing protein [Phycisphaerae bacterium]|jgi:hypothetical protein|nr:FecR domain-containing protein [Phycisphaerae bacterium]
MLRYTIIIGVVVALSTGSILAQAKAPAADKPAASKTDKAAKPPVKPAAKAPAKNTADKLQVTVVSVSGIAEQRSAAEEKAKWAPMKAGDVLDEMTLIRTGLGGKVVLKFSNRGNVTVKSGTKIGIASFRKQGKLVKTRLGLKYGAIRAKVDSTKGANDFRVRTAVGTLAARGTGGDMAQWGDFSFQAKGTDGAWQTQISNRVISLLQGEWTDKQLGQPLAAMLAKHGVKVGDRFGGLTLGELKNLLINGGGRGIVGFIGNAKGHGAPRLIRRRIMQQNNNVSGGPVGGSDDPDKYADDPERGRGR